MILSALSFIFYLAAIISILSTSCRAFSAPNKHLIGLRVKWIGMMSADYPKVTYIEPADLAVMVHEERNRADRSFVIVDVRDDDYYGGHIPGAVNIPSLIWDDDETVENLINNYVAPGKEKNFIVFHCMQSMQRGPSCAMRFANRLSFVKSDRANVPTEVKVLRGGFRAWRKKFENEADLIEDKRAVFGDY